MLADIREKLPKIFRNVFSKTSAGLFGVWILAFIYLISISWILVSSLRLGIFGAIIVFILLFFGTLYFLGSIIVGSFRALDKKGIKFEMFTKNTLKPVLNLLATYFIGLPTFLMLTGMVLLPVEVGGELLAQLLGVGTGFISVVNWMIIFVAFWISLTIVLPSLSKITLDNLIFTEAFLEGFKTLRGKEIVNLILVFLGLVSISLAAYVFTINVFGEILSIIILFLSVQYLISLSIAMNLE